MGGGGPERRDSERGSVCGVFLPISEAQRGGRVQPGVVGLGTQVFGKTRRTQTSLTIIANANSMNINDMISANEHAF